MFRLTAVMLPQIVVPTTQSNASLFDFCDDKCRETGNLPGIEQSFYSRFIGIFRREINHDKIFVESFYNFRVLEGTLCHDVTVFTP